MNRVQESRDPAKSKKNPMLKGYRRFCFPLIVGGSLTLVAAAGAAQEAPSGVSSAESPAVFYDEIRHPDGTPREQYVGVLKAVEQAKADLAAHAEATGDARLGSFEERFDQFSRARFRGDNALDSMPLVLSQQEAGLLEQGARERGEAIRHFLKDLYSGQRTYEKAGIIPQPVVERLLRRSGEIGYVGSVKPDTIAFPYGPDVIRAANGKFYVIEDNPGYVGGFGDLEVSHGTYEELVPEVHAGMKNTYKPSQFYDNMVASFRRQAEKRGGGKLVLWAMPPTFADKEDWRIMEILKARGFEIVNSTSTSQKIVKGPDGLYLETSAGGPSGVKRERIGFLYLNGEHNYLAADDPRASVQYLLGEAREHLAEKKLNPLARRQLTRASQQMQAALAGIPAGETVETQPAVQKAKVALRKALLSSDYESTITRKAEKRLPKDILQAITEGKVATSYAPGIEFTGDKEFYTYVDDLVRFYLKKEPILGNIPTQRFAVQKPDGGLAPDEQLFEKVFGPGRKEGWVVKRVDGRGGDAVYIGPKLSDKEWAEAAAKARAEPEAYIVQGYQKLSQAGDKIGDIRELAWVGPDEIVTGGRWSRSSLASLSGKVNVSAGQGAVRAVYVYGGPAESAGRGTASATRKLSALADPAVAMPVHLETRDCAIKGMRALLREGAVDGVRKLSRTRK